MNTVEIFIIVVAVRVIQYIRNVQCKDFLSCKSHSSSKRIACELINFGQIKSVHITFRNSVLFHLREDSVLIQETGTIHRSLEITFTPLVGIRIMWRKGIIEILFEKHLVTVKEQRLASVRCILRRSLVQDTETDRLTVEFSEVYITSLPRNISFCRHFRITDLIDAEPCVLSGLYYIVICADEVLHGHSVHCRNEKRRGQDQRSDP